MTQFEHSAVETLDRLTGIFKYLLFAEHLTGQYKESCRTFGDTAVPGPLSVWSEYCSAVAQYRGTGAAATLFALVGRAAVPGQERQYTVRGDRGQYTFTAYCSPHCDCLNQFQFGFTPLPAMY